MPEPKPARLLVADDEPTILDLLQMVLTLWKFEVEVCADGEAALARALNGGFALLLIDHQMPALTGIEVLKRLRAANHPVPAVLMSGHLSEDVVREAEKLQGVGLLAKPFTLSLLRATVDRALGPTSSAGRS